MRLALGVEYDGTDFMGWQRLSHGPSVQAVVEQALSRVANHPVEVTCAGRTDSGVHAAGQVVHFDTDAERPLHAWILGSNSQLPPTVAILWAQAMPEDFHARYQAVARSYRYTILNRRPRPALDARRVAWVREPLDEQRMHRAAQALLGEHDFSSFRAAGCQARTAVRRLTRLAVFRRGERVMLEVQGNAFLHHMVRNIAGALIPVGLGEQPEDWLESLLAARDRTRAGITAPASGLVFLGPDYPAACNLPRGSDRLYSQQESP